MGTGTWKELGRQANTRRSEYLSFMTLGAEDVLFHWKYNRDKEVTGKAMDGSRWVFRVKKSAPKGEGWHEHEGNEA